MVGGTDRAEVLQFVFPRGKDLRGCTPRLQHLLEPRCRRQPVEGRLVPDEPVAVHGVHRPEHRHAHAIRLHRAAIGDVNANATRQVAGVHRRSGMERLLDRREGVRREAHPRKFQVVQQHDRALVRQPRRTDQLERRIAAAPR